MDGESKKKPGKRVRKLPPKPNAAERYKRVLELVTEGGWEPGRTAKALAEEWHISLAQVYLDKTTVLRSLGLDLADADEVRLMAYGDIARCARKAEAAGQFASAAGSYLRALEVFGLAGVAPELPDEDEDYLQPEATH